MVLRGILINSIWRSVDRYTIVRISLVLILDFFPTFCSLVLWLYPQSELKNKRFKVWSKNNYFYSLVVWSIKPAVFCTYPPLSFGDSLWRIPFKNFSSSQKRKRTQNSFSFYRIYIVPFNPFSLRNTFIRVDFQSFSGSKGRVQLYSCFQDICMSLENAKNLKLGLKKTR
jgi:hypothetical protein